MIVYADREREADTAELEAPVREAAARVVGAEVPEHEDAIELLVAFGDLETAVVDAIAPERDGEDARSRELRRAALAIGALACATWTGASGLVRARREQVALALAALDAGRWPARVRPRVPEGYAFYSLRPEMYLEAAAHFAAAERPGHVVCIGLRSIGTSLSAVVSAALADSGAAVRSFVLRPRGHPFDRQLVLSAETGRELREAVRGAHVAIVDEGPGLSGSSFASAARVVSEMGVPDERIVLFPSWVPDPERFVSEDARRRFRLHRSYAVDFEDLWLRQGRLARAFSARSLSDLSAGRWRAGLYGTEAEYPAVHPQHERRKYLAVVGENGDGAARRLLLKFAGLGPYGRASLSRARALAATGHGPAVAGLREGFLAMDLVPGRPLVAGDAEAGFLDTAADYIAALARLDTSREPVALEPLLEMTRQNVSESLGQEWASRIPPLFEAGRAALAQGRRMAVDGRMLPHEWLRVGEHYVKTDGVDHHDDHLFPGRQDAAWDVAGTIAEFELDFAAAQRFVSACRARLADPALGERLRVCLPAYLAFRIGYCAFAETGVDDEERRRFERLRARYEARLKRVLDGRPS